MKKYIILSYTISRMGGGQMYQYNKLKYMKSQGYDTYVMYAVPGNIKITDFNNVAQCMCVEELNIHPCVLGKKRVNKILKEMLDFIRGSKDMECIVESCNKPCALWGELLSKELHGTNYPFIIDEKIGSIDSGLYDFFSFKRKMNQLKGVKNETYEMIFGSKCDDDHYSYYLAIPGNNVVQDIDIDRFNIDNVEQYDLKICTIGNLNKEYVPELIKQIIKFADKNLDIKIYYCMIGDSPDREDIKKIQQQFDEKKNITLELLGSLYPIPEKLLRVFDLFISSAGSARVSGDRAIPTITIDSRDHMAIGIYQLETDNTVFRGNEELVPISQKIEFVYSRLEDIRKSLKVKDPVDFNAIFDLHLKFFDSHKDCCQYYDVLSMKLSFVKYIERIIYCCFGKKIYDNLRKLFFERI